MKEVREGERGKRHREKGERQGLEKRSSQVNHMAAEKLMREQERREIRHLVTSSVPSPPFSALSILNPATLTVFGSDPRAVLSAHLFASYAAANPDARFQIPIPLSIAVSNPGQPIYQNQPTQPPQIEIISSWVADQQKEKSKKKKQRGQQWETSNKRNESIMADNMRDRQTETSNETGSMMETNTSISPEISSRHDPNLNNNNNHDNLNKNQSNQASRDKQFTCQVCNRGFGYKHVLQNHQRTHTGEKPFECTICQKRFTRDHHLKTHMRLHTGEKPYQCPHCDRQFVQVANLRRHLRVHTGEKPYACDLCKNKFSDSNQLKAHMLIHKGEKPYGCPSCEGRFRRRHHLLHHKCVRETGSPPNGTKRERKSRETRRIIRIDAGDGRGNGHKGPLGYLPGVPEQTHPEDLSTHSLNFSSSHSSCSASPSPPSTESHGSVGLYSVGSSEEGVDYTTDEDVACGSHSTGKTESDDASPSQM